MYHCVCHTLWCQSQVMGCAGDSGASTLKRASLLMVGDTLDLQEKAFIKQQQVYLKALVKAEFLP